MQRLVARNLKLTQGSLIIGKVPKNVDQALILHYNCTCHKAESIRENKMHSGKVNRKRITMTLNWTSFKWISQITM